MAGSRGPLLKATLQQYCRPCSSRQSLRKQPQRPSIIRIPFNANADYHGVVSALPPNMPFSVLTSKSRVLDHALVVIQMSTDEDLSSTQAARNAYLAVFKNERRLPHGAVYVVVNVYGPPTAYERGSSVLFFPKTGYIFLETRALAGSRALCPKRNSTP